MGYKLREEKVLSDDDEGSREKAGNSSWHETWPLAR
jgi:hypothetical protein